MRAVRRLCVVVPALLCLLGVQAVFALKIGTEPASRNHFGFNLRTKLVESRQLLGSSFCPQGCSSEGCVAESTQGGLRCNKCLSNLVVVQATGVCACVAGRYASGGACLDCPRGSYCPRGTYAEAMANSPEAPVKLDCPVGMTTLGSRSTGITRCVNQPGSYYTLDPVTGAVSAVTCPVNTFGPGLKKQRSCVPCTTGYTTGGRVGQSSPTACVIPAGYYLKTPGQVAPCPKGEWNAAVGSTGNCTKCTVGVTTASEGATSPDDCAVLLPGFYAVSMATPKRTITAAAVCPQGYVCPGNTTAASAFDPSDPTALSGSEPSIQACPLGQWTKELGAISSNQCLTPPGYFTANAVTQPCPDGSFRADWKPAAEASSCTACGVGVLADKTDRLTRYNLATGAPEEIPVTTSTNDCYIQSGQGLYYETLSKTWCAKNCDDSNYGVANQTYGLTPAPCKACPTNMIASKNATTYPTSAAHYTLNADNSGGFTSVMACVTIAAYGYSGRVAQRCDQGTYNEGGNYDTCKPCPLGTTTAGPGAGKAASDCKAAAGYANNGVYPVGTYNDDVAQDTPTCKSCPNGTTTDKIGADSPADCKLCRPGFGGAPGSNTCTTKCGGIDLLATYGPAGRAVGSPCLPCQDGGQTIGFSFTWGLNNDVFVPKTISRDGASTSVDCLAEFGQYQDAAWFLPLQLDVATNVSLNVQTFADCVALCPASSDCQFVTYDYVAKSCTVRRGATVVYEGMPWVGFKALPSGSTATNPWSVKGPLKGDEGHTTTSAKAVAGGLYTWWQDPSALVIGQQSAPHGVDTFTSVQDCVTACDFDGAACVGVTMEMTVDWTKIGSTCKLIRGDSRPGRFKRTVVRTELSRVGLPTAFLCPSGWIGNTEGSAACMPNSTPQQVSLILTAAGACNATTTEAIKTALIALMSDPGTMYGAYTPNLVVDVGCLETGAFQVGYGFSRRLAQTGFSSDKVAIWVSIKFTGTTEPVLTAVNNLKADPCKIHGFCSAMDAVKVVHVTGGQIDSTNLVVKVDSYTPGTLRFKTAFVENGIEVIDTPFPLRTNRPETNRGKLGACTSESAIDGKARLWKCEVYIPAGDTIALSVTVPNTLDPGNPITKSVDVSAPGTSPCPSGCASVTNSNGVCTAVYGGVGVVCGCNSGFAWDAGSGTCAGAATDFVACSYAYSIGNGRGSGAGQFEHPIGVTVAPNGDILVTDGIANTIKSFAPDGAYLSMFGSFGTGDGQFTNPTGIATDSAANIYVADSKNCRVQKFLSNGTYLSQFGGCGSDSGKLSFPMLMYIDKPGDIFVADAGNERIQKFSASGAFLSIFESPGAGVSVDNAVCGIHRRRVHPKVCG